MNKFLLSMLTLASILTFSSCSSEDDPEPINNALLIAGTYSGYTESSSQYFSSLVNEGQSVTISANEDGTANVTFSSTATGNVAINNATVLPTTDGYIINGQGESVISGHGDGGTKTYECNLTGFVGSAKDNAALEFTLPSVMGGMKIKFVQGDAPAGLVAAGDYEGYTLTSTAYFQSMLATDEDVKITANEDGSVKIDFDSDTWGAFSIPAATATRESNGIAISGSGKVTMPGMNGGAAKEYDCTVAGTINAAKDDVTFTFTVPSVMGGTNIVFVLGQAPASLVAAGSYDGYFDVATAYFKDMISADETVKVTANEDGTVNISFDSATWGAGAISNATAKYSDDDDDIVAIEGKGTLTMPGMNGGAAKEYECNATASIESDKVTVNFTFTVPSVMGGTTIKFNLGEAPKTE